MNNETQLDLYQQVILEHNRNPRNFKKLSPASHEAEGYNPLCGDHLWIYLNVSSSGLIEDLTFHGNGCAISKASASMMTAAIKGKDTIFAQNLFQEFQAMLKGEINPEQDKHSLGSLKIFAGVCKYPSRVKCAILAWHTMSGALHAHKHVTTET